MRKAIDDALNSPLLNDNDVYNSQKILLSIAFSSENGTDGLAMEEMNEINDFMSRFGSNFELKWGIAIDNTLEKKVKITILATGFGLDDLEDVASYHSRLDKARAKEEAQKKAEQEEADAERSNRRGKYYGDDGDKLAKPRPHIYLFSQDDLDNEDVHDGSCPYVSRQAGATVDRAQDEADLAGLKHIVCPVLLVWAMFEQEVLPWTGVFGSTFSTCGGRTSA